MVLSGDNTLLYFLNTKTPPNHKKVTILKNRMRIRKKNRTNKKNTPNPPYYHTNNHTPKPPLPHKQSKTKQTPINPNLRQKPPPTICQTKLRWLFKNKTKKRGANT